VRSLLTTSSIPTVDLVHLPEGEMRPTSQQFRVGSSFEPAGWGRLTSIDPVYRTLGTTWLWDAETSVLFTSDAFGAVSLPEAGPGVVDELPDDLDGARVRRHLLQKFDWLARADCAPILRAWDALFGRITPHAIAPAHGCAVRGAAVVRLLELYRGALESF
jgi:hypothetical protein